MIFLRRAAAFALLVQCGAPEVTATPGAVPAPPADAGVATQGNRETFAIDTLFLGDTFRPGETHTSSDRPWRFFGYNLDGWCTFGSETQLCTLAPNASTSARQDGNDCIDNAWGSLLLPMLASPYWYDDGTILVPNISDVATTVMRGGAWTLELTTNGLDASMTNELGLALEVRVGAPVSPAALDPSFDWPVLASSDLTATQSTLHFDAAYVSDGTFVSGSAAFVDGQRSPVVLPLMLSGARIDGGPWPLTLRIHAPVITFARSSGDPTHLRRGVIAGTLDPTEAIASAHAFLEHIGGLGASVCGPAFLGVAGDIARTADILSDGTNADGVPCSAISIGIGFEATQIANPTTSVPDPPPPMDTCIDGGSDAASD